MKKVKEKKEKKDDIDYSDMTSSVKEMFDNIRERLKNRPWYQKIWDFIYYKIIIKVWEIINPVYNWRRSRFLWQRITRGFDDSETWSLDDTIAKFILPRLKRFRELELKGVPGNISKLTWEEEQKLSEKEAEAHWEQMEKDWNEILDKMILAFETIVKDDWKDINDMKNQEKNINEGLSLFAQYLRGLWW